MGDPPLFLKEESNLLNITPCYKICSHSEETCLISTIRPHFHLIFHLYVCIIVSCCAVLFTGKAVALLWVRKEHLHVCYVGLSA